MEAERIAAAFHEAYERLAPSHGYDTREASAVPWAQVPENNRNLMIATVADLIEEGELPVRPEYPFSEGDCIVIGPECFAASDGSILNWRGVNYTPQPDPKE